MEKANYLGNNVKSKEGPLVSVIIPHWNGIDIISECLDSLKRTSYPNFEVIVVDNASNDGSPDWIKKNHPWVILIENNKNAGYAGGCNLGSQKAQGDLFIFLNNDTIQDSDWIQHLVNRILLNDKIGAVQPKLLNYYQKDVFDYAGGAGGEIDILCFPFARGRLFLNQEKDLGQYDRPSRVFWASGTAFIIRKDSFEKVGRFDEYFFAHMEEIDLCWRLQLYGLEIWSEPDSIVYHKNAVSLPMNSYKKFYLNHRNSLLMLLSNYSFLISWYLFPIRFVLEWVAFFYAMMHLDWNHMRGIIGAQIWVLTHPGIIRKRRKIIKYLRRIQDRDLMLNMFPGSIVLAHYLLRKKTYREINFKPSS